MASEPDVVVTHSGAFEWMFVFHHYGIALDNLRDTLLMARLVACGDMSVSCRLEEVAFRELDVRLDKEPQQSDWSADPLSEQQLTYAAMDAFVLPHLHDKLLQAIADTGQERVAEIEHEALSAFALMKYVGMSIDRAAWNRQTDKKEVELLALERKMF